SPDKQSYASSLADSPCKFAYLEHPKVGPKGRIFSFRRDRQTAVLPREQQPMRPTDKLRSSGGPGGAFFSFDGSSMRPRRRREFAETEQNISKRNARATLDHETGS